MLVKASIASGRAAFAAWFALGLECSRAELRGEGVRRKPFREDFCGKRTECRGNPRYFFEGPARSKGLVHFPMCLLGSSPAHPWVRRS